MKPLQMGLLVVVGAFGGAMIMRFTQSSSAPPAPISANAPAPAAQPSATPAPVVAENVEPAPEPVKPAPMPPAEKPVKVAHVAKPSKPAPMKPKPVKAKPVAKYVSQDELAVVQAPPQPEPAAQPAQTVTPETQPPVNESARAEATPAPAPDVPPPPPSVTLPAGMLIHVRLGEALSSEHNQAADTFTATLDSAVTAGGFVIAERGARVEGRVAEAQKAGRVQGTGVLALELTKLHTSDGQHVPIRTDTFRKQAASSTRGDVEKVAAVAGIGAAIGAIAGGGKGAAIGAAAGGAAGAGGAIATHHSVAALPPETRITFRLSEPVALTERSTP